MNRENSVENRIFEKLRNKTTDDFRNIPESKRTVFDNDAIKLADAFEFVMVPTTKKERSIKTLFMNRYSKVQTFIEVTMSLDPIVEKRLIVFRCGDKSLKICYNYFCSPYKSEAGQDMQGAGLIELPYQITSSVYGIIGDCNKTFSIFEEVEDYLVEYVVEYTKNFKLKKPVTSYH